MSCRATSDQLDPDEGFFAGLQQVRALAVHRDGVATDLTDCLRRSAEQLWLGVHEVMRAVDSPVFFISEEGNDEVALGLLARAEDVPKGADHHGVHVFHVNGAASPQHSVLDLATERVDGPVGCVRWNDVGVAMDDQSGSVGPGCSLIGTLDSSDHGGAPGSGVEVLRGEPEFLELCAEVFGGVSFAVGAALAIVSGVETD
jgi:hypothetical protein